MRGIQVSPCIYDADDLLRRKIGEGKIMVWSKSYDITFAGHGLCTKKARGKTCYD